MSQSVPSDWQIKDLEQVCEIILGQSPPSSTYNTEGNGLPFFQGKAEFTNLHPVVKQYCTNPTKIAKKDDILLSIRAPIGPSNIADRDCGIGRGLAAIRYTHNKYIFYYLRHIERQLDELGTGSTFKAITGQKLKKINVPLAPLDEQKKIVAKIEELFSELDQGKSILEHAETLVKTYKASLLGNAFTTANNHLEGITKIGDAFDVFVGATPSRNTPEYWNGHINWVSSGEVAFQDIYTTKERITEQGLRKSSTTVHPPGTVLLAMIGEGKTRGRAAILRTPAAHNQNTAAIRVNESRCMPEYLFYYLMSKYDQTRAIGSGNNQKALNKSLVQAMTIPLPHKDTQKQIVDQLHEKLTVIRHIEGEITDILNLNKSLKQSILSKAFTGELI